MNEGLVGTLEEMRNSLERTQLGHNEVRILRHYVKQLIELNLKLMYVIDEAISGAEERAQEMFEAWTNAINEVVEQEEETEEEAGAKPNGETDESPADATDVSMDG